MSSESLSNPCLDKAPKRELVRVVRDLHRLRKSAAPGQSVLMSTRNADLVASIRRLLGRDYELDEGGRPRPAAGAPTPAADDSGRPQAARGGRRGSAGRAAPPPAVAPPPGAARRAAVIRLLATENPKRPGSAAHARFALLRDGMTVEEFIAAAGPIASGTLHKAVRRGHVRLEEPGAQMIRVKRFDT